MIMLKGMWLKEAGFDSITEDVSADIKLYLNMYNKY